MTRVKPWLSNRILLGCLVTIAIILVLFLLQSSPAKAVQVVVSGSTSGVSQGDSITFTATVTVQSGERIPIQGYVLRIFSDSGGSTQLTSSPYLSPHSMSLVSANPSSGYYTSGVGYGYDSKLGYGYSFPTGYGYSGPLTLTYQCTLTTSTSWSAGTYYVRADIDCGTHTYSSVITSFSVTQAGGGGGATPVPTIIPTTPPTVAPSPTPGPVVVDLTGRISPEGFVTQDITVISSDGNARLTIPAGTRASDAQGNPLDRLIVQPPVTPPQVIPGMSIVVVVDFGPSGATFSPPIGVTMRYDPSALPQGAVESELMLAYYDDVAGRWVVLSPTVVDTVGHTIGGNVSHFTQFAVLASVGVSPTPTIVPTISPTPTVSPTPPPTLTPTATPTPPPTPPVVEKEAKGFNWWVAIAPIIAVLVVGLLGYLVWRRREEY